MENTYNLLLMLSLTFLHYVLKLQASRMKPVVTKARWGWLSLKVAFFWDITGTPIIMIACKMQSLPEKLIFLSFVYEIQLPIPWILFVFGVGPKNNMTLKKTIIYIYTLCAKLLNTFCILWYFNKINVHNNKLHQHR